MEDFSKAYARILKATGCDGQEDLSQTLGISQALISDSRRRGKVSPEILLALLEEFALDPHWIRTGEGERYFDALVQMKRVNARLKEAIMNKEMMNAVATDVFVQAQEGFAVPLDPDLADALGAFVEDAPSSSCSEH